MIIEPKILKTKLFTIIFIPISVLLLFAFNTSAEIQFDCVFISDGKIDELKQKIEFKTEPTYTAYLEIKEIADQALDRDASAPAHWYIPGYYVDAKGHTETKAALQNDANIAYQMALVYRMTGDERYAQAVARLAHSWATEIESMSQKDDSTLSFSYHFPALIFAVDLIRESAAWSDTHEADFTTFVRNQALTMNTMNRNNNWGNWGLVLVLASAVYLEDQELFAEGIERWKHFIEHQIAEDGHMPHEVHRSEGQRGIWYTHFSLFPQTIAAEIAFVNGVDLYDYQSPNGRNLQMAYERVAQWSNHLETFPYLEDKTKEQLGTTYVSYFEILHPKWPNPDAKEMIEKHRPMNARHSAPALTFTHGFTLD